MNIHFRRGAKRRLAKLVLLFGLASAAVTVQAQAIPSMDGCGILGGPNQYGPYDYRTDKNKLPIVLGAHFTPEVEAGVRGKNTTRAAGDISYTLRAIPNMHRALISIMKLGEKEKRPQPLDSQYTIECWLSRAINFRPDDVIVRMLYASYLGKNNRAEEANAQLAVAELYAKDSALTHYNIGLHYFDLKNYDKALEQAHLALSLGWMGTELREELVAAGKWQDVPAAGAPALQASAPASAASAPAPAN